MKYNEYEFDLTKDGTDYSASVWGESFNDAVRHHDFWSEDGNKMSDYTINGWTIVRSDDVYPYTYEDALRAAFADKIGAIHRILQEDCIADFDKVDLIRCIVDESPARFARLDTACRDYLPEIMEVN